jgi:hypothetical protein
MASVSSQSRWRASAAGMAFPLTPDPSPADAGEGKFGFEAYGVVEHDGQAGTAAMGMAAGRRCRPHSLRSAFSHHQRPARSSSPWLDRAGAWRAADARVAAVVQRVVGHRAGPQVGPYLVARPVGQRIEFREAMPLVELLDGGVAARERLVAAQPGDPGALAHERARERRRLAQRAAVLAQVQARVEGVRAVRSHVRLDGERIGRVHIDRHAVVRAHAVDQRVRFFRQPPGVQREDADRQLRACDQVDQDHVLRAEARGQHRGCVIVRHARKQAGDGAGLRRPGQETACSCRQPQDPSAKGAAVASRRRNHGVRCCVSW